MKVDSGAAVSAIPKKLSDSLNLELKPADRNLMGAGNKMAYLPLSQESQFSLNSK